MNIQSYISVRRAISLCVFTTICSGGAAVASTPASQQPHPQIIASVNPSQLTSSQQKLFDIYKDLVETNTVHPIGDNTKAATLAAKHLLAAGFAQDDVKIIEPAPRKGNLVVRYKGTSDKKPVLLLAHIDVVDAKIEDWGTDPFKLVEREGYYYGRGTIDDKAMAAGFVHTLIRLKQEGYRPPRDIILALTADEEGGTHNGVAYLLDKHRSLIDAEYALNEGGAGVFRQGKPWFHAVQGSEKMYLSFEFIAKNKGGHSSQPQPDNAIYDLARALDRVSKHQFPVKLSFSMKQFFHRVGTLTGGASGEAMVALANGTATDEQMTALSRDATLNAQMRTTCVATRLEGGHADNALPQQAKATVNCRLLPGESREVVQKQLDQLANPENDKKANKIEVLAKGMANSSPESSSQAEPYKIIEQVSESMWPGVPVVPSMSAGATDGMRLRLAGIPTYGASGMFIEFGENRLHGKDERIGVQSFYESAEFLYRAVKALSK